MRSPNGDCQFAILLHSVIFAGPSSTAHENDQISNRTELVHDGSEGSYTFTDIISPSFLNVSLHAELALPGELQLELNRKRVSGSTKNEPSLPLLTPTSSKPPDDGSCCGTLSNWRGALLELAQLGSGARRKQRTGSQLSVHVDIKYTFRRVTGDLKGNLGKSFIFVSPAEVLEENLVD